MAPRPISRYCAAVTQRMFRRFSPSLRTASIIIYILRIPGFGCGIAVTQQGTRNVENIRKVFPELKQSPPFPKELWKGNLLMAVFGIAAIWWTLVAIITRNFHTTSIERPTKTVSTNRRAYENRHMGSHSSKKDAFQRYAASFRRLAFIDLIMLIGFSVIVSVQAKYLPIQAGGCTPENLPPIGSTLDRHRTETYWLNVFSGPFGRGVEPQSRRERVCKEEVWVWRIGVIMVCILAVTFLVEVAYIIILTKQDDLSTAQYLKTPFSWIGRWIRYRNRQKQLFSSSTASRTHQSTSPSSPPTHQLPSKSTLAGGLGFKGPTPDMTKSPAAETTSPSPGSQWESNGVTGDIELGLSSSPALPSPVHGSVQPTSPGPSSSSAEHEHDQHEHGFIHGGSKSPGKNEEYLIIILSSYGLAKSLFSHAHFTDFRSLLRVSKRIREATISCIDPQILKSISCSPEIPSSTFARHHSSSSDLSISSSTSSSASNDEDEGNNTTRLANNHKKTTCFICNNQICTLCTFSRPIAREIILHLCCCEPYCGDCFRKRFCGPSDETITATASTRAGGIIVNNQHGHNSNDQELVNLRNQNPPGNVGVVPLSENGKKKKWLPKKCLGHMPTPPLHDHNGNPGVDQYNVQTGQEFERPNIYFTLRDSQRVGRLRFKPPVLRVPICRLCAEDADNPLPPLLTPSSSFSPSKSHPNTTNYSNTSTAPVIPTHISPKPYSSPGEISLHQLIGTTHMNPNCNISNHMHHRYVQEYDVRKRITLALCQLDPYNLYFQTALDCLYASPLFGGISDGRGEGIDGLMGGLRHAESRLRDCTCCGRGVRWLQREEVLIEEVDLEKLGMGIGKFKGKEMRGARRGKGKEKDMTEKVWWGCKVCGLECAEEFHDVIWARGRPR